MKTGRAADIGDLLDQVRDHRDVVRVVEAMRADLLNHPREWENHTLDRYLEALAGITGDVGGLLHNRGEKSPAQPSWALVAQLLVIASGYE